MASTSDRARRRIASHVSGGASDRAVLPSDGVAALRYFQTRRAQDAGEASARASLLSDDVWQNRDCNDHTGKDLARSLSGPVLTPALSRAESPVLSVLVLQCSISYKTLLTKQSVNSPNQQFLCTLKYSLPFRFK